MEDIIPLRPGQWNGFTKYPCFICLWSINSKDKNWARKQVVREKNIIEEALIDRN